MVVVVGAVVGAGGEGAAALAGPGRSVLAAGGGDARSAAHAASTIPSPAIGASIRRRIPAKDGVSASSPG